MKIVASTILREARVEEQSSAVYVIDLDSGELREHVVPDSLLRHLDNNSRGGMRGARGIAVADGAIFVANYDSIFCFDEQWKISGSISHPECADIHDIAWKDDRLWVASTRNDRLLAFDRNGDLAGTIDPWATGIVERAFGVVGDKRPRGFDWRDPRTHEKEETDRLHVNSFCFDADGSAIVVLGQMRVNGDLVSALVKLGTEGGAIIYSANGAEVPAHNVVLMHDGSLLHADTARRRVIRIESEAEDDKYDSETVLHADGFIRGIFALPDGRVAVGVQNEVWITGMGTEVAVQRIVLSDDRRISVHSIAVMAE